MIGRRFRLGYGLTRHVGRREAVVLASLFLSGCSVLVDRLSGRAESCEIIRAGEPAQATVIALNDTGTTINRDPVVEFVLLVQPHKGLPYQARTRALISRLEVPQAQPGRVLPVRFDPRQPKRVAIDLWDCDG